MRYYFHIQNGETLFDEAGIELSNLDAVRQEALLSSVETLRGHNVSEFWSGEPWKLWVTDAPNGSGNTVLAITFASGATH
jgi:hypothetical protein